MGITEKIRLLMDKPLVLEPRTVFFNQHLPSSHTNKHNEPLKTYYNNEIRTTKYTPFSFIPKNLFFQFQNIANIYFFIIIVLGLVPSFGVDDPGFEAVPLCVIVGITAIKDAVEDSRRTISDLEVNNSPISVLRGIENHNVNDNKLSIRSKVIHFTSFVFVLTLNFFAKLFRKPPVIESTINSRTSMETFRSSLRPSFETEADESKTQTSFETKHWKDVKVGDIIRLHNNEEAPADIVILSTSDADNGCFIETKNLDGETNLKVRRGLDSTQHIRHSQDMPQLKFQLHSEAPSASLRTYLATLEVEDEYSLESNEEPVGINNLILRGSTLRNTKRAIGIVVFTGKETKIMMNAGITPSKKSRISRELNFSVMINFVLLFILCFISGLVNGLFYRKKDTSFPFFEFEAFGKTPASNGVISFCATIILYQSLVPISLYISVEIVKTLQAMFIYCDAKMYDAKLDYRCTPKSWNISDDLGQVEYVFSDKTGTLTQNVMEFKKATINGKSYGLAYTETQQGMDTRRGADIAYAKYKWERIIEDDRSKMIVILNDLPENPHFNADELTFISSDYLKDLAGRDGDTEQSEANYNFMLYLSLCHTVLTEPLKDDATKFEYRAESPDEAALVQAASDVGFTFIKRTRTGGILNIQGIEKTFDILKTLEFTSTRKRMSVIARLDGQILLISKGADSIIYGRLDPDRNNVEFLNKTSECLEEYAREGLRTLCVATRSMSEDEYSAWEKRYDLALISTGKRDEKLEELCSEIESNLVLIGGTAIEDRLQVGVPESIEMLSRAGIKLWVLTGDKIETAINIGFSCNLLGNGMELLVIQPEEGKDPKEDICMKLEEHLAEFEMTGSIEELKSAIEDHSIPQGLYAVIIDGDTLKIIFEDDELQRKFLLLCKQCKSVLCCRVSPAQKAQVVKLVKDTLDVMTLAIGDGANDVAMIQAANVGVGIVGEEGRQAAMSSDYAFGQFRFLTRLLLVHGRWSYKRFAEMIPAFFYKNVQFTLTLFFYGIYNNFDGSYLFEYTYVEFFQLLFTSLPAICLAVLDQDVSDTVSMKVPELYMSGILRQGWSQYKFVYYMIDGAYQAIITFFFPYFIFYQGKIATYNGLNVDHRFWIGVYVISISVTTVNIYVLLRQYRWDWLTLVIDALSVLIVFLWTGAYSSTLDSSEFFKAAPQVFGQLSFWACFFVGVILNLLPSFALNAYRTLYKPRDIDIIRECASRGDFNEEKSPVSTLGDEEESNDMSQITIRYSLDKVHTAEEIQSFPKARTFVRTLQQASSVRND